MKTNQPNGSKPAEKKNEPAKATTIESKEVAGNTENVEKVGEEKNPEIIEKLTVIPTAKKALEPNEVIQGKNKAAETTKDGNVIVKGKNVSVKVSALTAKMISKFK